MKKIQFHINKEESIQKVQENFSLLFPSLRINFFGNSEKKSPDDPFVLFSSACRIRDIKPYCQDGSIEITDDMTVSDLENDIQDILGLHAEISSIVDKNKVLPGQTKDWLLRERYPVDMHNTRKVHPAYFGFVPFGC
jgi:hypothetical protein